MESDAPLDFASANKIGMDAMARMAAEHIPPVPKNYAVWYAYFSHLHPELNHAIEIISKSTVKVIGEQLGQLYDSYLHERVAEEQILVAAGNRLQETLVRAEHIILEAGAQTNQFSANLDNATDRLDDTPLTPEALKDIVGQLVDDAKAMQVQNEVLQGRLSESTQELNALKQDLAHTREEAMTDGLTGINNRKSFDIKLLQSTAEAIEEDLPLSLLLVDIDFFKKFNDTYGHQAGDQIIRLVAQTFQKGLKGQDTAARYGGEEFAIILPNTPLENAIRVAEVLRRAVASKEVVNRANQEKLGQITISVGAAQYRPDESLEGLIERADAALYRAKQNGRNRVEGETAKT